MLAERRGPRNRDIQLESAAGSEIGNLLLFGGSFTLLATLHLVAVAAHKLLNPAGGIHQFLGTGVERVAEGGNVKVHHVVSHPVDFAGLTGFGGRDAGPFVIAVNEEDWVAFRVNACFHERQLWHKNGRPEAAIGLA